MIDDMVEGGIRVVLGAVGRFLFRLIVEIFLFYTGEIVLFILTLGRKKPRWDSYAAEKPTRFWVLTDLSALVGLVFWLAVLGFVGRKLGI
ncbi:MAG: hypothetical protein WC291_04085 [Thermodesulfovibrionales bacterium]|jgi:hypothetical protein